MRALRQALLVALLGGVAVAQPSTPAPAPAPSGTPAHEPPATGPGLGVPKPLTLNPAEQDALKDVEAELDNFQKAGEAHDKRLRELAKREFDARTAELEKRYADRVASSLALQKKRHTDTIALLEKFLQDHPAHDTFTPDAMFRLADLYLDQADEDVEAKLAAQEQAGGAGDQAAPIADYSKALALWESILTKFPNYRQTPSTLYLLAYYGKTKDERKSLQIFLALACANHYKWNEAPSQPPTRQEAIKRIESKTLRDPYADCTPYKDAEVELVRHAWVRGIADYHFTVPGELDEAIAAYRKVADNANDSKLYAESLYKLAWSYYKRDFLKDSIANFDKSVKLYDQIVASGGQPPLELRDESIQYIAVALTDPWEGETDTDPAKAFQRAQEMYKGRENEPHVRDVWVALGHAFADLQAWDQAVDSYRIAIGPPWELNPKNPQVHQEIVNAFEAKGDKFAADQAAAELATKYGQGTAWYTANEKDRDAMETQRRIAERALYAAALNTHSAATTARKDYDASAKKDPQAKQDYLALYAKSVDLYREFIRTYADSDYVYEFSFNEGEALFYSERYPEAIEQYTWVRDHRDLGTTHYLDAARSIMAAYEAEKDKEVAEGKLQPLKVPTVADLKVALPWQPKPIPPFYQKLQGEYDNYQNIVNDPAAAPGQGMNAALISLAYYHVDDAISRFQKVMDKFCNTPPATKDDLAPAARAKDGILAIYEAQGNYDAIEATNKRFVASNCGDAKAQQLAMSQNRSLNFQRATDLFTKNNYIPAAEAFYRFYATTQKDDPDRPVALFNSAVSYKLGDRPKTAIGLFKEFTQNPDKKFRDSAYYLKALSLTAESQQASFQYDEAIKSYLDLYATTQKFKKAGMKPPEPLPGEQPRTLDEIGLDAVYNAAFAAEVNRDFKQAISLYNQYLGIEKDRRKKDRAQWEIAGIYRQSGDVNSMTDALDKWRRTYGNDAENADDYVKSYYDTAKLLHAKGRTPQAKQAETDTIAAWKKTGAAKNSKGAKMAAEYAVADAEDYYTKTWVPLKITRQITSTNVKQVKAEIQKMKDSVETVRKKAEDKYRDLDQYGVLEATMAATVRYGDIQYDRAQKIGDFPVPKIIQNNPDAVEAFEKARDEGVKKDLDEAKTDWAQVLDAGKKAGVSNKWSQHAAENLAREFPDEYHVLRQELVQGTDKP